MNYKKRANLVIVILLGAQIFTGFIYYPEYPGDSTFPFLDYPMYSSVYKPDKPVYEYSVYGITETGQEIEINSEDFRLDFWKFYDRFIGEMLRDQPRGEILRGYAKWYRDLRERKLAAFRLEKRSILISRKGVWPGEERTSKVIPL